MQFHFCIFQVAQSSRNQVPPPPSGPLEALRQSGGRLLLEWGPQRSVLGSSNIKGLVLEKKEEGRGRWITIATLSPNKRSYMIERTTPDVTTHYRLSAENAYGKGQPIEVSSSYSKKASGIVVVLK